MKIYLVTGAAGFIGSSIAARLVDDGHEVWTIDNLTTGRQENIPLGVHFIKGSCQEENSIRALNHTVFDAILHLAGQSSGEISFDDPVYDLQANAESTLRLIDYGLAHGCHRFIYTSSMSVYGNVADAPINENHATKPLSFYGIGKLASEHYLRIYMARGLKPTAMRLFNVYGPHQNLQNLRQGMVSIYLAQMLCGNEIIVKGDSRRFRDLIYIDDVVDAFLMAIENSESHGKIFNIATGRKTTVATLLEKLQQKFGKEKKIVYQDVTSGDQPGIYADVSLAKRILGFEAKVNLEEGLLRTIEWARR